MSEDNSNSEDSSNTPAADQTKATPQAQFAVQRIYLKDASLEMPYR